MAQQNWWEAAPVVERPPAATPGYIPGRAKQPTQLEIARENRAIEDQNMQRRQFDETMRRQDRTEARLQRQEDRQAKQDAIKLEQDAQGTESERTAAFLATRLAGSLADIKRITASNRDAASPELDTAILGGIFGRSALNSSDRQRVEDAQLDILDAALTLGTGAAYTKEQLEGYRQSYFPQYWDSPEAIKDKEERLSRVLDAARIKAGRAAPQIDAALQATGGTEPVSRERQGLTVSNIADIATGLSGGDYTPTPDGGLSYNGEPVSASAEVLNSDQYREAYRAKFGEYPPVQVDVSGGGDAPPDPRMAGRENAILDPFIRGAADTLTLGGADEISAAVQTVLGDGTMRENLRRERAIDAFDEQNNPVPRIAGQVAGGFGLPTGGVTSARGLAGIGAGYASGYGFGSSDGSFSDRLLNAGLSAPVGAAGGYLGGRVADYLGGRIPPPGPQRGSDVAQAALDQGVDIVRPDAQPNLRGFYSFAESMPVAGGRVRADLQRGNDQMAQRLIDVGGGFQTPRPAAGEAIRGGAERYIARSRDVVNRGYERARAEAGNATATPTNAVSNLNAQIAELNVTPEANAAKLNVLTRLRADMVDANGNPRALPVDAVRNLRTAMRDELNASGLRFSDAERRVMAVLDEAGQDIANGLTGRARRAYDRADRLYRERAEMIDDVVRRFVGRRDAPTSSEKIMGVVDNMAAPRSGDERRLGRMMQVLQPAERQMVASSIAGVLGRGGDQAADFSAQRFFTEIKKYSPEAREAIFGQQGARDIQQLATIAEARQGTLSRFNNSGSGRVSNWMQAITSVLSGGGLGGVVGAATGAGASVGGGVGMAAAPAVLGGVYLRARALGNPRFIAALAAGANARNPQQQRQAVSRLTQIANREPGIAADVLPIRDFLAQAIEASPGRLAASENENRRRPEVPQDRRP